MPNWPALVVPEGWGNAVIEGSPPIAPSTDSDVPTGQSGSDVSAQQSGGALTHPTGVDIAAHMSNELGVVPPLLPDHIAAHVAPDLGVSLVGDQTGKPVVDAAHHIAVSVSKELGVDPPAPAGIIPAEHIAKSVAPDLGIQPSGDWPAAPGRDIGKAQPVNPMVSQAPQEGVPRPYGAVLRGNGAPVDPRYPNVDFDQAAAPEMQDQQQRMLQNTLDIYAQTGRMPLGMFTAAGIPTPPAPEGATPAEQAAQQAQQTGMAMHGPGPLAGGGVAAATAMFGPKPAMAPEGRGGGGPTKLPGLNKGVKTEPQAAVSKGETAGAPTATPLEGEIISPAQQLAREEARESLASGYMDATGNQSAVSAAIAGIRDEISTGETHAPNGALWEDVIAELQKMRGSQPRGEIPQVVRDKQAAYTATPEESIAASTGKDPPKIVRTFKVPYLAGSSVDGSTLYLHSGLPETMTVKAANGNGTVTFDPAHPLGVHEGVEHAAMVDNNAPYETAHRVALKAEQKVVAQLGGDWQSYQEQMHKWAEQAQATKVGPGEAPPDLYTKPYPHQEAEFLQREGQATQGTPTAARLPPANVPDFGAAPREEAGGGGRQPPTTPPGGKPPEPPDFGDELGNVARRNVAAERLPSKVPSRTVTEMEDDLHRLRSNAEADRAEAENFMRALPEGTSKRDAELYRIGEHKELQGDPDYQKYGVPLYQEELRLVNRLRELTGDKELQADPEWMHRMVQGKTPRMDEAIGAEEALPYKGFRRTLSTAAEANKSRGIYALEDAQGNRKIVTEYPGGDAVYAWENGKPTKIDANTGQGYGGFIRRVPEKMVGGQEIPWRRTIDRPVVAKAQGGRVNLGYVKPGGKEIPAHTTPERLSPEHVVQGEFKPGDEFHALPGNKVWQIKQAKTDEIERAGVKDQNGKPITYHKSFFASKLTNIASLRRAVRNAEFLDKWKNSPAFKAYTRPLEGMSEADRAELRKQGWTTVDYPGLRDNLYHPRLAEPLNDFFHGIGNSPTVLGKALEKANQIATDSMFWTGIGSLAHARNETSMAFSARGFHNLDPRTAKWFGKAFDEVRHQGPTYIQALREGAHLPSAGMKADSLEEHLLKYVGEKIEHSDPASLAEAAKAVGLSVKDFIRARQLGFGRAVFKYGDMLMMEHIIRQMDRGYTMRQAIDDAEKLLPTYRIRSRTGGTGKVARMTSEVLGNRNITQFGRFTADKGKFWNNLIRDSLNAGSPFSNFTPKQRMDAVGRLTATIVLLGVIGPYALDRIAKELTGDKNAHINLGGAAGWAQHAINAIQSVKSGRMTGAHAAYDFLNGFINVAPAIKELLQQVSGPQGLDWFTNQHISESNPSLAQYMKERAKHAGATMFSPYNLVKDPMKALREPFGLSVAKPFSDRPRSLGAERRQQIQDLRTRNR